METVSPSGSALGDHNRDMESLVEIFGSSLSLEAIASAYAQASRDVEVASSLLFELQVASSETSKESADEQNVLTSKLSSGDATDCAADKNFTDILPKNIASGFTRAEHVKSTLSDNGFSDNRPLKEQSIVSSSGVNNSSGKDENRHEDVGEFLFNMLGDGFQLDMKKIYEVLGLCGYDLEKSMETLVDLSASSLEKSDVVMNRPAETEMYQGVGFYSNEKSKITDYPGPRLVKQIGKESRNKNKGKCELQREILNSLFSVPERIEEQPPKRLIPRTRVRRSSAYGRTAVAPLKDTEIEQPFVVSKTLMGSKEDDEEHENSFPVLRQAVREYWVTMKEYYKAAADAYTKGDKVLAYKLMKEGKFFNRKAREADEQCAEKLLETRDEEIFLDFSTVEPRETLKHLRLHLTNLSGIPSIRYLKVKVGIDNGQSKKGGRKRLVLKFLAKESIEWTEADNGETIVLRLEEINRESLSFAKKPELKL